LNRLDGRGLAFVNSLYADGQPSVVPLVFWARLV
jgi:hypothetical protein